MKNGFALVTCLAIVVVIALGTAGIFQAVSSHANMKANTLQEVQAKYLAEAGMEYALWHCRTINGGCSTDAGFTIDGTAVPITTTSLGGGSYTIQTAVDYVNQ